MNVSELVEAKIQEAIKKGEFDDLPNQGKPIDLDAYFQTPAPVRMAHHVLKNAGVLPSEVTLMKEIAELRQTLRETSTPETVRQLTLKINDKSTELNFLLERYRRLK